MTMADLVGAVVVELRDPPITDYESTWSAQRREPRRWYSQLRGVESH
jgi:hypothetical protein